MLEPSPKDPQVDDLLTNLIGKDRRATILSHKCMTCERPITCSTCNETYEPNHSPSEGHPFIGFRDRASATEYTISGMCQRCQDDVWGAESQYDDLT